MLNSDTDTLPPFWVFFVLTPIFRPQNSILVNMENVFNLKHNATSEYTDIRVYNFLLAAELDLRSTAIVNRSVILLVFWSVLNNFTNIVLYRIVLHCIVLLCCIFIASVVRTQA